VSILSNKKVIKSHSVEVRIASMPKSRLPELIDKAKASGLSYRDIQRRAGGEKQIAHSTLYAAHKGESENLTLNKILALAKGLGESPITVFEAAMGKSPTELKDETVRHVLEDFSRLSLKDQNDPLLRAILEMLRTEIQKRLDRDA
jgi:hypothetical protein